MPNGSPGFFFLRKAFRMNEQPVSQIPIKGDWGCFPNKQICEDCTEGKIEKMSEPVQVYTACQFVTPIIYGQNYSQVGNKKLIHLHLNWVEVSNLTSAQLEQKLIRTCSQLGHKLYVGRKLANRAKLQHFAHFRIFSFASICKMTCQGKLPDTL